MVGTGPSRPGRRSAPTCPTRIGSRQRDLGDGVTSAPDRAPAAHARRDANAIGLRYVRADSPGIRRKNAGRGFAYEHPERPARPRCGDARSHPGTGNPSGLDRGLDLPRPGRPPPGDRPRRPRPPPVPLPRSVPGSARPRQVRPARPVRRAAPADPPPASARTSLGRACRARRFSRPWWRSSSRLDSASATPSTPA